jgi:alkanesulfonate monooxygenase SsuD/methylene tetrahydromethanopterin reductase-like flavin-dependent oxidoreductase (luciferase family)
MGRWICFWRLVVSTLFIVAGASMISNFRSPADAAEQVATLSSSDRNRVSC